MSTQKNADNSGKAEKPVKLPFLYHYFMHLFLSLYIQLLGLYFYDESMLNDASIPKQWSYIDILAWCTLRQYKLVSSREYLNFKIAI